uniref:Uncharacterized protein n=1 Tax=Rhizophora mucronata TaxID=61149 RepID=A0A2P2N4A6_RHIMU
MKFKLIPDVEIKMLFLFCTVRGLQDKKGCICV